MNRLKRSGAVRFRELDYSGSPNEKSQQNKTKIRSKDDVLKLFNNPTVEKENVQEDAIKDDPSNSMENSVDLVITKSTSASNLERRPSISSNTVSSTSGSKK